MELRILGCAGGSAPGRRLSGYLLDDVLAVDAGSLTTGLPLAAQRAVQAVLLTHAHLDHCWSFPLFLANRFSGAPRTIPLHGPRAALEAVKAHLFNDAVWPRHEVFTVDGVPLVRFHEVEDGERFEVLPGYAVTAIGLDHTVATHAYLVRHEGVSLIVCGDTGPTDRLWEVANAQPDLRALVIECSFPDRLASLAAQSGHLTPATLAGELQKLERRAQVLVTHVKPEEHDAVVAELEALGNPAIHVLEDGEVLRY
jgi:ribonuclease BN (tRNA processing enzyme)